MKKVFLFLIITVSVLQLCSCSVVHGKMFIEIKDENREDTSLAVLKDEDICTDVSKDYCLLSFMGAEGDEGSFPDDEYYDSDRDQAHMTVYSPFSGVKTVQPTYGKTATVKFTVTTSLTKGNLWVCLVDMDNLTIVNDFAVNTTDTFMPEDALGKEYTIRVAGESAEFSLEIVREFVEE